MKSNKTITANNIKVKESEEGGKMVQRHQLMDKEVSQTDTCANHDAIEWFLFELGQNILPIIFRHPHSLVEIVKCRV